MCGLAIVCGSLLSAPGSARDLAQVPRTAGPHTSSLSRGLPWDGQLLRGVRLRMSALVRPVGEYARQGHFFATAELVSLLERSAQAIATRWPGSQLSVGELSAARGGKLEGHHSHRSGRDADIAFFVHEADGQIARVLRFVAFGSEGIALGARRPLYFDDARNWALVAAMLRDHTARLQYMFVAQPIRTRLLMEGRRRGESDEFLRAAAAVLVQPKERHAHDNHFHVRIYCPADDRPACQDSEPYWPWYEGTPPSGRFAELPLIRWHSPSASTRL
jgi:penicillin-insensitive murein DD-endopeptidase